MAIGALFSAAVPAAVQFGSQFFGGLQQYKYQRALQEQAAQLNYDYGQKSLLHSPSSTRQGLESAGYNPMLAVQNATTGANSGWTSAGTAKGSDYANIGTDLISNAQSLQRLTNETKTADSTSEMNSALGRKYTAEAVGQELKNPYIPQSEQQSLNKMGAETQKLMRETSFFDQLADNMEAERRLQEMGINTDLFARMYSADKAYNASTYAANRSYDAAKYGADMYDRHLPSGRSESFKNYMFGAGAGIGSLGGVGSYALNFLPRKPFGFH